MMPVVEGKASTRKQILAYALALFPVGLAPAFVGLAGPLYLARAALFGGWLVYDAIRRPIARRTIRASPPRAACSGSILYLFVLFAALIAERLLGIAPLGAASFGAWM